MLRKLSIVLVLFTGVQMLYAQGWNQKKGEGYFQLGERYLSSPRLFFEKERVVTNENLTSLTTEIYGEYGLSDKLMLIAYVPVISNRIDIDESMRVIPNEIDVDNENSLFGLGEIQFGGAYSLVDKNSFVMNVYGLLSFPTMSKETYFGLRTSDEEASQQVKVGIGYGGFYPIYTNASLGFHNRNKNYSDAFIYSYAVGVRFFKDFIISIKVFGQHSIENGSSSAKNDLVLYANNAEYIAYGPELIYEYKEQIGVFASFMAGTSARNVQGAPTTNFGLYYKLK